MHLLRLLDHSFEPDVLGTVRHLPEASYLLKCDMCI
jgi:hypothetical protein